MKRSAYTSPTKRRIEPPSLIKRFEAFMGGKKHASHATTEEDWEEDAPSRPVVRLLVVLLLLHIVVIGGILLRGSIIKSGLAAPGEKSPALALKGTGEKESPAPAPAPVKTPSQIDNNPLDLPAPLPTKQGHGNATTAALSPIAPLEGTQLIDEPTFGNKDTQLPAAIPAAPAAGQKTATGKMAKHLVLSGDTWESIAKDYACTVADLKKVNAKVGSTLRNNIYLAIPSGAVTGAEIVDEHEDDGPAGKTYTIKKGDTLSKIARKNKVTLSKLMKANNFTEADTRKIKPDQVIKLP